MFCLWTMSQSEKIWDEKRSYYGFHMSRKILLEQFELYWKVKMILNPSRYSRIGITKLG